eukprot:2107633-Rhodomonas_salina.2
MQQAARAGWDLFETAPPQEHVHKVNTQQSVTNLTLYVPVNALETKNPKTLHALLSINKAGIRKVKICKIVLKKSTRSNPEFTGLIQTEITSNPRFAPVDDAPEAHCGIGSEKGKKDCLEHVLSSVESMRI